MKPKSSSELEIEFVTKSFSIYYKGAGDSQEIKFNSQVNLLSKAVIEQMTQVLLFESYFINLLGPCFLNISEYEI